MAANRAIPPSLRRCHEQVITRRRRLDSAGPCATVTAVGSAACTAEAAASVVGLVTEQVDVQQVEADAAPTLAAIAAISTEAAVGTVAAVAAIAASAAVASIMTTTMTTTVMTTTTMTTAASTATGVEQGQDGTGGK
jgi:hypothetical protein